MKLAKIFKVFKKGSKAAGKRKGSKPSGGFEWPSGMRLGVFGHSNAGKTVFYTVLNEECKISRDIQMSTTDNATAGEFLRNFRAIWGLGTTTEVGTVVDLHGEKKFPDPTVKDRLLLFNAILDGDTNVPIVALDYPGASVSISDPGDLRDKVGDFMDGCDGLLFFFDPKVLQAELQTQAHVAAFANMIERLAPLGARLPIPVALVVTKSDILDGYAGDDQVTLVADEDENLLSENFERFLERVLSSSHISSNPTWSGSVRTVLVKLREFLKIVIGRTLDFQVFFVSATGSTPEKVGTEIGRSVYKPPERINPIGVKDPFNWVVRSISRNRRISRLRAVAKYVAIVSVVWAALYSIPFVFHFTYLLPQAMRVEANILDGYNGNMYNTSSEERRRIVSAYTNYDRSWTTKYLFPRFQAPAGRVREKYSQFNLAEEIKRLDQVIDRFSALVDDSAYWPKLSPSDTTLVETEVHVALAADLEQFHRGDSTAVLFRRSDRMLQFWNLFRSFVTMRGDSTVYNAIADQVQFNARTLGDQLSVSEVGLGEVLTTKLKARAVRHVQQQTAQRASIEVDDIFDRINSNDDPVYRLVDAVTELGRLRGQLDPTNDAQNIAVIDRYIATANRFKERRKYTYKVESVPGQGHLHVEVTGNGEDPAWAEQSQIIEGFNYSVRWKMGDDIHIALDTLGAPENWGRTASDKKILKARYSLFEMDGEVSFDNISQKVSLSFTPDLRDALPVLKK